MLREVKTPDPFLALASHFPWHLSTNGLYEAVRGTHICIHNAHQNRFSSCCIPYIFICSALAVFIKHSRKIHVRGFP